MSFQFQAVEIPTLLLADFQLGLFVLQLLLFLSSLFLMLLVLVQRGKGGGLTGALGGSGGNSAFGAKAGDAFTKITIVTAAVWIFLCMITIAAYNRPPVPPKTADDNTVISGDADAESTEGDSTGDTDTTGAVPADTDGDPSTPVTNPSSGDDNAFEVTPSNTDATDGGGDSAASTPSSPGVDPAVTDDQPPAGDPSPTGNGEPEEGSEGQ